MSQPVAVSNRPSGLKRAGHEESPVLGHHAASHAIAAVAPRFVHKSVHNTTSSHCSHLGGRPAPRMSWWRIVRCAGGHEGPVRGRRRSVGQVRADPILSQHIATGEPMCARPTATCDHLTPSQTGADFVRPALPLTPADPRKSSEASPVNSPNSRGLMLLLVLRSQAAVSHWR